MLGGDNLINERKNPISDFGMEVKLELMKRNKTQNWLIEEIKKLNPTMFIDSSILYKVLTGQVRSGKIVDSVKAILEIKEDTQ